MSIHAIAGGKEHSRTHEFVAFMKTPEMQAKLARGDHFFMVSAQGDLLSDHGRGDIKRHGDNSIIDLRPGGSLQLESSRTPRLAINGLKATALIATVAIVGIMIGYMASDHWFKHRLVNPYGYGGGYGGYGGY